MISMLVVFYLFLILFAMVGAMRGWGKELLISFSVILALAFIVVIETYVPIVSPFLNSNREIQYWVRMIVVVVLVLFGYQSPRSIARLKSATEKRERVTDFLVGILMGVLSGYMIIGTLWYFTHAADYFPIKNFVTAPTPDSPQGEAALELLRRLPPAYLAKTPNVFIAVVLAFIFVIVVFI